MPDTPSVVDQYDIGDEPSNTPEPTATPSAVPAEGAVSSAPPVEPSPTLPPKDPTTGRFLPKPKPPTLVATAKQLGFDDGEIEATPTAELRALVQDAALARSLQNRETIIDRSMERSRQVEPSPVSEPPAVTAIPPAGGSPTSELGLDEEQYDPGLIAVLKSLKAENKELREMVGHQHNYIRDQINQTTTQKIDGAFAKLGGHYEGLLGKGERANFQDGSPEHVRRMAVVGEAARMAGQNAKVDQVVAKIADAAKLLFGVTQTEPPKPQPKTAPVDQERVDAWRSGGLATPTNRIGAIDAPGPGKAEQGVKAYLADNGLNGSNEPIEDL